MMSDLNEGLIWASKNGKIELAQLLIDNGADVNAVDKHGRTALRHACKSGHLEIAKLLTRNKARFEIDDNLLVHIVIFNKKEILKELTTNGSTIKNYSNNETLYFEPLSLFSAACKYTTDGLDREEINKILIENGLKFCYEVFYNKRARDILLVYKLPAKGSSMLKNCQSFGLTFLLTNEEFEMISVEEAIDYMEDLEKINKKCYLNSIN